MSQSKSSGRALGTVRVVDLTRGMSGPYCTMLLADLGAEVIKIEPPEGDLTRDQGPFAADDELRAFGGFFQSVNRSKKSIAIDMKAPAGRELVRRLAAEADVLVENFRAGVMERLGLAYEVLRRDNPRLVYAAIRGFGDPRTGESPYSDWPAWDIVAQAMGGLIGITGYDRPVKAGPGVGDIFPGTLATVGILAALTHARESGEGQFVDVAMYDGILSLCERIVYQHSYSDLRSAPQGNVHPYTAPFDVFPAQDGWLVVAAATQAQWSALCQVMERPELVQDPRFVTNADRARNRDGVHEIVGAWTAVRTKAELMAALGGRVPIGPVNTNADILADPHAQRRGMLVELPHPGAATPKTVAGPPIHMTATPPAVRDRAPLLGEHTAEILEALDYSRREVTDLHRSGVVLMPEEN